MPTCKLVYIGLFFELRCAYPMRLLTLSGLFKHVNFPMTLIVDSSSDCGVCQADREPAGPISPHADDYQYEAREVHSRMAL